MKDLFDNVAAQNIINFIQKIQFLSHYMMLITQSLDLNIIFTLSL